MSTIKHPVGPQSSSVYWRRRLVVGLGLLAVLVIIFLIIVRPGSSSGEPQPTTKPAAGATDKPAGASAAPAVAGQAASVDGSACVPGQVTVEAITDAVTYKPGQQPQLSLSVTNTGKEPCVLDVGTSKQVFTISSGKDVYWTSTDCQTDPVDAQVSLKPGKPVSSSTPIDWDRTRSAPETCDVTTRDAAPAGGASYYLTVTVAGMESAQPKQFLLY